ncbi:hypothetical protein [Salinisphaera sp. G21_0]|uniref:hypothetical protein n=1 Tax=Salinisphaera sp. G21_0 TaxID=2821094 RepID=UPI001AD967A1|nr:hypothetical protein [Salinisphaera sp. G21_0]MBO9481089.1 hypothetical protein [Salinisphaera sp. G21_0]
MSMPSISAQNTAETQPQFHGDQEGESASAAPVKFDRWMISLSEIDSFLRGKDREAFESIAERMCTRAEYQQDTRSYNLSNPGKDSGACALPVDDSQGCSQGQKVKNVTGLILRLQSGVHQLLDEVNGHFAKEPFTGTKDASQAGDGNIVAEDDGSMGFSGLPAGQPDPAYQSATVPSSSFATADPAATPVAPTLSYDALSHETETKLAYLSAHMERLMRDQWGDGQITECRNQMQWIKGELNSIETLGLKHFSGKFREVRKQFEELQVKDFHHRLDKLEEVVNIGSSKDIQSIGRDNSEKRVLEAMGARFEQAKLELAELHSQFNELKEKLQPCKGHISDSQQTATNSEVKNKIDPLEKEFGDYWKEFFRKSKYLEEQFLQCSHLDLLREQHLGKMMELRDFYLQSSEAAKVLIIKFVGIPAYENEHLMLNRHIENMLTQIEVLNKQIYQQEQEENREKRSGCMQS